MREFEFGLCERFVSETVVSKVFSERTQKTRDNKDMRPTP